MAQVASLPKKTEAAVEKSPEKKAKKIKAAVEKDLTTLKQELRNLVLDIRTGKEKNTSKQKELKKQIARLLTKQNLQKAS